MFKQVLHVTSPVWEWTEVPYTCNSPTLLLGRGKPAIFSPNRIRRLTVFSLTACHWIICDKITNSWPLPRTIKYLFFEPNIPECLVMELTHYCSALLVCSGRPPAVLAMLACIRCGCRASPASGQCLNSLACYCFFSPSFKLRCLLLKVRFVLHNCSAHQTSPAAGEKCDCCHI